MPALTAATVITFLRRRGVPIITASVCTSFVTYKVLKWSWLRCQKAVAKSAEESRKQVRPTIPLPSHPVPLYKNIWLTTGELAREGDEENDHFDPFAHLRDQDSAIPLPAHIKGFTMSGESLENWAGPEKNFRNFILEINCLHRETTPILLYGAQNSSRNLCLLIGYIMWEKHVPVPSIYAVQAKSSRICLWILYIMLDKLIKPKQAFRHPSYKEALQIVNSTYFAARPSQEEQAFLIAFEKQLVNAHRSAVELLD